MLQIEIFRSKPMGVYFGHDPRARVDGVIHIFGPYLEEMVGLASVYVVIQATGTDW